MSDERLVARVVERDHIRFECADVSAVQQRVDHAKVTYRETAVDGWHIPSARRGG